MRLGVGETRDLRSNRDDGNAQVVRIARYSVYPRANSDHGVQTALTRDAGDDALHLVTSTPETVGELLRISLQGLGDSEDPETLARVVGCDRLGEGRFELTVRTLDSHRPRLVRRP